MSDNDSVPPSRLSPPDTPGVESSQNSSAWHDRSLIDCIPHILWVCGADGGLEFYNRRWTVLTGLSVQQALAQAWREVVHPEDRDATVAAWMHAVRTGTPYRIEHRIRCRDGQYRWMLSLGEPQRGPDGTILRWFGSATDIHEQKRYEAEVRRREQSLRLLRDCATQLLLAEQPEQYLQELFPRLSEQLGLEVYLNYLLTDDGRRLRLNCCGGIDPDLCAHVQVLELRQAVCGMVAASGTRVILENVQDNADERVSFIRRLGVRAYACYPLLAHGRLVGTLSFGSRSRSSFAADDLEIIRTVCDQIAMTLERSRLTSELAKRTEELEQRNRELQQASLAKDRFLAVLSHELRTPLTPVLAAAELLAADPALPAEARDTASMIRRNAGLEARLIDDLLDLTRIGRGKLKLDPIDLDGHHIIRHVLEMFEADLRAKRQSLTVRLEARSCRIHADAARFQQVLWNLLKNAVKFTPVGGNVEVRTREEANWLVVEVRDNGIGIEPQAMTRIFNAFDQGGTETTQRFGGLGLGLTISRALAESHGGTLTAHSGGPGRGAVFSLRLPLAPGPADASAPDAAPPGSRGSRAASPARILLVEDHADTARILARLLQRDGHEVATVGTLAGALQAARGRRFDLIISDLGLPDGSGLDLIRRVRSPRSGEGIDGVPAVALSGYGMEEDLRRSAEAGFNEHLTKPVDIAHLRETIARLLRR